MSNSVAIITARGGSKRIPRKNIKSFLGKPIIAYSIEAALKAGCFTEVMVSTDDEEIANIALEYGAKVPFFRSKENSDDFSTTTDVLKEVILEYKKVDKEFDSLCCIYPTAPFVTAQKIKDAMELLFTTKGDCVLPVVKYSYPIQRSLKLIDGKAVMIWPENYFARSQDLEPVYHDCGLYYCMNTQSLLSQMKLFAHHTIPIIAKEEEMQDIDTEEDWEIAEAKFKFLFNKK